MRGKRKKAVKPEEKAERLPTSGSRGPTFQFTSLSQADRSNLVEASGAPAAKGHAYVPVNLVELTALGASLDLFGHWNAPTRDDPGAHSVTPPSADIAQWRQITNQGRDDYVRVVYRGYLFPLGLRAIFVKVVDRIFVPDPVYPNDHATAYLQLREYIRIVEPTKTYPAGGQPFDGNGWPYVSVTAVTQVSPFLAPNPPALVVPPSGKPPQAILPQTVSGPVIWTFHALDDDSNVSTLQLQQAFVFGPDSSSYVNDPFDSHYTGKLAAAWNALDEADITTTLPGSLVRFAPEVANGKAGSTTHPAYSLQMLAATTAKDPNTHFAPAAGPDSSQLSAVDQPNFYPSMGHVNIRLHAAEALSGQAYNETTAGYPGVQVKLFGNFVAGGFPPSTHPTTNHRPAVLSKRPSLSPPPNLGSVYSQMTGTDLPLSMPANAVGGISQPNLNMAGLSAAAGILGGQLSSIANYAEKAYAEIQDYFANLTSGLGKIFGGLPFLSDLAGAIERQPGTAPAPGESLGPALIPHLADPGGILGQFTNVPQNVPQMQSAVDQATGTHSTTYTFQANLQAWNGGSTVGDPPNVFDPNPVGGVMTLTVTATVSASSPPTFSVNGSIDPFNVTLLASVPDLAFITIPFASVTFTAGSGMKTDVDVNVGQVIFLSPLSFINQLAQILQNIGGSGFSIDVTPSQVSAQLTLAIPSLGGVLFTFENLAFSAGVTVPFLGDPTVATFAFCSQDAPFQLTVDCIGGGGYCTLSLGMAGVQAVAASFDLAASIALDLAVASGGVSLSAGFTYSWQESVGTTLTAFIQLSGEVEVIGILSISIVLEISLGLVLPAGSGDPYLTGTGSLSLSVGICCFSVSVTISVTKTIGIPGGGSAGIDHLGEHELPELNWVAPNGFAGQFESGDWANYCGAFAG